MSKNTDARPRKKGSKCCSCCIAVIITLLVLILAGSAIGLGIADNYLKTNYTVGVGDCFNAIGGLLDTDAKKILTDPASEQDNDAFYGELKKTLFLGENVDLEGVVINALDKAIVSDSENVQRLQSNEDKTENGDSLSSELTELIGDLYKEGNVDLTRLRKYINGEVDIDSVYDNEFTVTFKGNYLVGLINTVLNSVLAKDPQTADFAGKVEVKQLDLGRTDTEPYLKLIAQVQLRTVVSNFIDKGNMSAPDFAISLGKSLVPVYSYVSATIGLGENAKLDITVNNVTDSTMRQMYKLIYGVSGTDVAKELNEAAEEVVAELRKSAATVLDMLSEVDSAGKIKIDVYGMIADMLNDSLTENNPGIENPGLTGPNIAKFLVGVLGSDEQAAIEARIKEDSRYGEENWQAKNAAALVETMADSFSLAKNYFVNGLDDNGNKIISVENGVVIGSDRLIGRVYSDALGNIYYKRNDTQFKIFISDDMKVSRYSQTGYNTFYSLDLHYNYEGADYTLYRSEDKSVIFGVSGDKVMNKNGTYTELVTLYVDADGNVYSDNVQPGLIEITKEQLTADAVFNILNKDNLSLDDILDFIDFSALRVNGVEGWKNPIKISDIQLVSLVGGMMDEFIGEDLEKANPTIAYASIKKSGNSDIITIGLTVDTENLLEGDLKSFVSLIGKTLYLELEADITLGKAQNEYLPVKVRYNDLNQTFTDDMLRTMDKIASEMNLFGSLENAARSLRDTLSDLNQKISITISDGEVVVESPAEIIAGMISEENEIDPALLIDAIDLLLGSDVNAATEEIKAKNPCYAADNWTETEINGFVEVFAEAFVLNKEQFRADDGINYSIDKIIDMLTSENGLTADSVMNLLDYNIMTTEGLGAWKNQFSLSAAQLAAIVDNLKDGYLQNIDAEVVNAEITSQNGKNFLTLGFKMNISDLIQVNSELNRIVGIIGDEIYAKVTMDVTVGATDYVKTKIALNDLSEDKTETVLNLLQTIQSDIALNDKISDAEFEIRKFITQLDETVGIGFVDGGLKFTAPQEVVFDLLVKDAPAGFTANDMTDALTCLMTSSADAAILDKQQENSAFADADWRRIGVNSFAEKFTDAYILKKDEFKVGVDYSLDKITDIMENGINSLDDISGLLDYETMKLDGFGAWKDSLEVTDAELAAILDSVKDKYLAEYSDMSLAVEYVQVKKIGNKSYICLGITLDTKKLIGDGMSEVSAMIDALGERMYVEITVDVTPGADTYDETKVRINELSESASNNLFELMGVFSAELNKEKLFGTASESVRDIIKTIDENVLAEPGEGQLTLGCAQNLIYKVIIGEQHPDFTANDMTDALTCLMTSSADAAILDKQQENSAFADADWRRIGVNSFAEKFTDAYILKKDEFKVGSDYSLDKITDIMENGIVYVEELSSLLDYNVMKTEGFGAWKTQLKASDSELAAIIDSVKDVYLKDYIDMNVAVEYAHIYTLNGKDYICLGVSLDTEKLIGGKASNMSAIIDAIGKKTYAQLTVDITSKADSYEQTVIVLNDLSVQETDKIFDLFDVVLPESSKEDLFGSITDSVRDMIKALNRNLSVCAGEGYMALGYAQDVVFKALIEEPKNGLTASEMTDALTALSTCGTNFAAVNNNFVADISNDEKSEAFWNDVLKTKYFINSDIKTLFGAFAGGKDSATALLDVIDTGLFTDGTGNYSHKNLNDQAYISTNEQLSWLFRANSSVMASMFKNYTFRNTEIYKTEIVNNGGKASVRMIIVLPSESIIYAMGELGVGTASVIENLLGDKIGVEISWADDTEVSYSLNGMNKEQSDKLGKLIYSLTGTELFGENSDISKAATKTRKYFCDYFHYEIIDGNGVVWMDYFYDVLQSNVFPVVSDKEEITSQDVYSLMKTLYERPVTDGEFDSVKVGYESNAETLELISPYVRSDLYKTVGALQELNISFVAPVAKLKATVRYDITGLGGHALKALPKDVFITVDYDAHPVVNGLSVSIDGSTVSARFNTANEDSSVYKCLSYLGVDIGGAVEMAHEQLDNYVRSCISIVM